MGSNVWFPRFINFADKANDLQRKGRSRLHRGAKQNKRPWSMRISRAHRRLRSFLLRHDQRKHEGHAARKQAHLCACGRELREAFYRGNSLSQRFADGGGAVIHSQGIQRHGHAAAAQATAESTSRRPEGSSMAVASSSTIHAGSMAMTPAMATRCFCPPERR